MCMLNLCMGYPCIGTSEKVFFFKSVLMLLVKKAACDRAACGRWYVGASRDGRIVLRVWRWVWYVMGAAMDVLTYHDVSNNTQ